MKDKKGRLLPHLLRLLALRSIFTTLKLFTGILIAHTLGQANYGHYIYIVALANFLTIPAGLGFERLLVRDVAIYSSQHQWGALKGLLRWSTLWVLLVSAGLIVVINVLIWTTEIVEESLRLPLTIGSLYVPIGAVKNLKASAIKGFGRVSLGFVPDWLLAPVLLIGLLVIADGVLSHHLSLVEAITLQLIVAGTVLLAYAGILHKILPKTIHTALQRYDSHRWMASALPMMMLGGLQIIHARIDLLMVGAIRHPDDVAIYGTTLQGMTYVSLILLSANSLIAPVTAQLYTSGKLLQLKELLVRNARLVMGLSVVTIVVLNSTSHLYFGLFGDNYLSGRRTLFILCLGQLVNAATGSVGVLLNMTGHERTMVMSVGMSVVLNIGLNVVLIPRWGIDGAAIATVISLTFVNLVKVQWVYRYLGLNVTCCGRLK